MSERKSRKGVKTPRKKQANYTLEDVQEMLYEAIEEYPTSGEMSYHAILMRKQMYPQLLESWCKNHPEEIVPLHNILKDIQRVKYEQAIMNGVIPNTDREPKSFTGLIWAGKTNLGMMTEAEKQQLKFDKEKLNNGKDDNSKPTEVVINVVSATDSKKEKAEE